MPDMPPQIDAEPAHAWPGPLPGAGDEVAYRIHQALQKRGVPGPFRSTTKASLDPVATNSLRAFVERELAASRRAGDIAFFDGAEIRLGPDPGTLLILAFVWVRYEEAGVRGVRPMTVAIPCTTTDFPLLAKVSEEEPLP